MQQPGERAGAKPSFWERTAQKFYTTPLAENLMADICVIGAGIAGVRRHICSAAEGGTVA